MHFDRRGFALVCVATSASSLLSRQSLSRLVVLNETARAVVEARRGQHPTHVFAHQGKPVAKMNNTAWQRALRESAQQYEADLGRPCPAGFAGESRKGRAESKRPVAQTGQVLEKWRARQDLNPRPPGS